MNRGELGAEAWVQRSGDSMDEKSKWIKPDIEEVELQSEDDVLATCYSSSQPGVRPTCRLHQCAR